MFIGGFLFGFIFFVIEINIMHLDISKVMIGDKFGGAISTTLGIALGYSIGTTHHHLKCSRIINIHDREEYIVLEKIIQILKKMHCKKVSKNDNKIVYKFPIWTIWREKIVITIDENEITLIGSKCYVDKIVKTFYKIVF